MFPIELIALSEMMADMDYIMLDESLDLAMDIVLGVDDED